MKLIFYLIILLLSISALGQKRTLHIKAQNDSSDVVWQENRTGLYSIIGLQKIQQTANQWHFRLGTDILAIDLWKDSCGHFAGELTVWAEECHHGHNIKNYRIRYVNLGLDSMQVKKLISLITEKQIEKTPDEDSIKGWKQGHDGTCYYIESANKADYYFKTYWTPTAQDSEQEAMRVQDFVDKSLKITDAEKIWKEFITKVPFECFHSGVNTSIHRILTKRERKRQIQKGSSN